VVNAGDVISARIKDSIDRHKYDLPMPGMPTNSIFTSRSSQRLNIKPVACELQNPCIFSVYLTSAAHSRAFTRAGQHFSRSFENPLVPAFSGVVS
jgi:hypothetical protein